MFRVDPCIPGTMFPMTETWESALAWKLLEKFALIAAEPNGLDGAQRQAWKLRQPAELVSTAFAIAEEFVRQGKERGYVKEIEDPEGYLRIVAEREGTLRGLSQDTLYSRHREVK